MNSKLHYRLYTSVYIEHVFYLGRCMCIYNNEKRTVNIFIMEGCPYVK